MSRNGRSNVPFNVTRKTPAIDPWTYKPSILRGTDSRPVSTRITGLDLSLIHMLIDLKLLPVNSISDFVRAAVEQQLMLLGQTREDLEDRIKDGFYRLQMAIREAAAIEQTSNVREFMGHKCGLIRKFQEMDDIGGAAQEWLRADEDIDRVISPSFRAYAREQLWNRGDIAPAREMAMDLRAKGKDGPRGVPATDSSEDDN